MTGNCCRARKGKGEKGKKKRVESSHRNGWVSGEMGKWAQDRYECAQGRRNVVKKDARIGRVFSRLGLAKSPGSPKSMSMMAVDLPRPRHPPRDLPGGLDLVGQGLVSSANLSGSLDSAEYRRINYVSEPFRDAGLPGV